MTKKEADHRVWEAWLAPYGVEPSAKQIAKLSKHLDLLMLWNRRISLTSLTDTRKIVQVLFGESLAAIPLVGIRSGRLADVGSGAGFPGLPLKILLPELAITLIEPNLKKSIFLEEVIRRLGLVDAKVSRNRLENIEIHPDTYDWVISRALAVRGEILQFSEKALSRQGKIRLWVGESEARALGENGNWQWNMFQRLPGTRNRVIMVGKLGR
jgi:16S rRNA (guanine527-N7)-methyltransferase